MQLLRNRGLLTLVAAEAISGLGSWITTLAVFALVVFRGGGGVAESSAIFLAALLPMLLFSPVGGWLADKLDRKLLIIASEVISSLVVLGLIFAEGLPMTYGLLALQAAIVAVGGPARQAALPTLVPREELTRANALLEQITAIVKIGGPLAAGFILTVLEPHAAMLLDVGSFVVSAAILSRLPALPPTPAAHHQDPKAAPEVAPGERAPRAQLALLYGLGFVTVLIIMGFDIFSSLIVRDTLRADEGFFGLLIGLVGAGSVVGSGFLMLRQSRPSPWGDIVLGLALLAALPAALAWVLTTGDAGMGRIALGVAALVGGVGNGLLLVQVTTLLQTLTPPALLGRASGLFQTTLVAGQLAALVAVPRLVPAVIPMDRYFGSMAVALFAVAVATALLARAPRATGAPAPAAD